MKSKRTILLALVLAIAAGCLAGCVDISNVPQQDASELSSEGISAEASNETSLPEEASAPPKTTAARPATTAQKTTAQKTTGAAPEECSEPQTGGTTQKAKTGSAFFDDAVFVGDSVTLALKNTATSQRNAG